MKIVHLCLSAFYIDNCSYQENMLPKYHAKMGHEVSVIASLQTFNEQGKPDFLEKASSYHDNNGYDVIRLDYIRPVKLGRFLRAYQCLYEHLQRLKPDIIFSHNVSFSDVSVLVRYLKKHPQVKCFADNHADYINSARNFISKHLVYPLLWRHYARMLSPYLVRCYGVTPMRCRFLREMYHLPNAKIAFLPMGVDDEAIPANREELRSSVREQLGIADADTVIFTGGKMDALKNIQYLVEALNQINNPNLHLIICGIFSPEMSFLANNIQTMPNIHYLGWCNASQVMNCMIAADFACFPGTHSTLWEQAVGAGLPAIFKRWNEMEHVNINGNVCFVEGSNVGEIKDIIFSMLQPDIYSDYLYKAKQASSSFLYSVISQNAINL